MAREQIQKASAKRDGNGSRSQGQLGFEAQLWAAAPLRKALDALLKYIRANYLEIDPNACGYEAMKHYSDSKKDNA